MVARVLSIDINKTDISQIASKLKRCYCHLLSSCSIEESLRIICTQYIDLVMITLPHENTKLFEEFFAVLRQSCGMIPIVGIAEDENISWLKNIEIDDVIFKDIDEEYLLYRINTLMKRKSFFDEQLIGHLSMDSGRTKKIVSFFFDDVSFLDLQVLKNPEIINLKKWPTLDEETADADLFIVNLNHEKALECCSGLRLRKTNKYKPIALFFDSASEKHIQEATKFEVGYSDIIDIRTNKIVTACRLNSLIKYKIFCETVVNL